LKRLDPRHALDELHRRGAQVEARVQRQRHEEAEHGAGQRDPARRPRVASRPVASTAMPATIGTQMARREQRQSKHRCCCRLASPRMNQRDQASTPMIMVKA
jgi:hypothetical protein